MNIWHIFMIVLLVLWYSRFLWQKCDQ